MTEAASLPPSKRRPDRPARRGSTKGVHMRQTIAAIILALLGGSAAAQDSPLVHVRTPEAGPPSAATNDCSRGVVYDDGLFADFYGLSPSYMVMKFVLPLGTTSLDEVCTCFGRHDAGDSPTLAFDVVVFDDDGAGGLPGTLLGTVSGVASDVPIVASSAFYGVSLADSGIVLPDNSVYIGVRFDSAGHYVCGDRSPETTTRAIYHSPNGASWTNSKTAFSGFGPNAWGIRVDPAPSGVNCTPTPETLCLLGGRFRVGIAFDTTLPSSGNARAVALTDQTGYFWFFDQSNVEVVVKAIDGCTNNDRFWFFAGGLTNVHTVITVTENTNGAVRTYTNPQGTPFEPVQDTDAFATCPHFNFGKSPAPDRGAR
ncbi:MAG: hypothetical protein WC538_16550 [Thermoanaerobaculia bacterium]